MPLHFHRALFPLAVALLCQCGAPQPPRCVSIPRSSRIPAPTLEADARSAWQILGNPACKSEWPVARADYNAAVGKLFDQLRCGSSGWEERAAALGTRIARPDERQANLASLDALFPAASVATGKVGNRQVTEGIGLPLVGWKKTTPVGTKRSPYFLPTGLPYNLTATLEFSSAGPPVWQFNKRWLHDEIPIGRTSQPLAADWTAPNAFYWAMCDLDNLTVQNVLLPERFMDETGLYFLQPYDPEKIPVVLIHGLVSSPDAFKCIINDLSPEPWFRQRYQIWLYNYPTGNPWLFSSMKFRELMRDAMSYARERGHDRNLEKMVIVSHSMGGLIARSAVTDPGTAVYHAHFKRPIDELPISPETRHLLRESTMYQPLKEPKRVVFLAVPHRGSPVATLRVSMLLSNLIRLPKALTIGLVDTTLRGLGDALDGPAEKPYVPTSINSLSPKSKSIIGLNKRPLPAGIVFHSIIGDRGRGDTPESSDGIVPYWSSHITPVASEKIVPSNHSVPDNLEAAAELKRILKLHLGDSSSTAR